MIIYSLHFDMSDVKRFSVHLHYDDVRGDVLHPAHGTSSECGLTESVHVQ